MIHGRKAAFWGVWAVEVLQVFADETALVLRKSTGQMFRVLYGELSFR